MRNLIIALSLLILSGCATQKRCWEKYPPEIRTEYIVNDTTIYSDTTIYIELPASISEVSDSVTSPCPEYDSATQTVERLIYDLDTLSTESSLAVASTWIDNSIRYLTVEDKDTTLIIRLENAIRERERLEKILTTEIHTAPPVKFYPWYMKLLIGAVCFVVGYIFRMIFKIR